MQIALDDMKIHWEGCEGKVQSHTRQGKISLQNLQPAL